MGRTSNTEKAFEALGAQWIEVEGRRIVKDYGDWRAEYDSVVDDGLGIVERGERDTLVIDGDGAVPWLQGLVTNDLHELVEEGSGHRNAMVNTTGRFLGEARVLHLPQLLMLDLEPGNLEAGLLSHLRGQIIREKVRLQDRTDTTWRLGFYGARSAQILADFIDWNHDIKERSVFSGTWGRWNEHDVIAERVVWSDEMGFEISCSVDAAEEILDGLAEMIGPLPMVGRTAFETLRVEAGVPRFGAELHSKIIPLEAGFFDAISFEKGCYLGQEIIARLDSLGTPAKLLRRIIFDGQQVPEQGTDLRSTDDKDRKIGHIESAVHSPRYESCLALGYVKRKYNDIGETVKVGDMEGRLEPLLDIREL